MLKQTRRPLRSCSLALALLRTGCPARRPRGRQEARPAAPAAEGGGEGQGQEEEGGEGAAQRGEAEALERRARVPEDQAVQPRPLYQRGRFPRFGGRGLLQKQREHTEYAYDINTRTATTRSRARRQAQDLGHALRQPARTRLRQPPRPVASPSGTTRLYAFKITFNPIPEARALSTGTVYISTGLLSQVDNEAQFAYVLGHEVAHIEKAHWKEDVLVMQGVEPYNEKQAKRRAIWGAVLRAAAAGSRGRGGGGQSAYNKPSHSPPHRADPPQAHGPERHQFVGQDTGGRGGSARLKYMLDRNYDLREVPKFYASLQHMVQLDQRDGLGFIADTDRINERLKMVSSIAKASPLRGRSPSARSRGGPAPRRPGEPSQPRSRPSSTPAS